MLMPKSNNRNEELWNKNGERKQSECREICGNMKILTCKCLQNDNDEMVTTTMVMVMAAAVVNGMCI